MHHLQKSEMCFYHYFFNLQYILLLFFQESFFCKALPCFRNWKPKLIFHRYTNVFVSRLFLLIKNRCTQFCLTAARDTASMSPDKLQDYILWFRSPLAEINRAAINPAMLIIIGCKLGVHVLGPLL